MNVPSMTVQDVGDDVIETEGSPSFFLFFAFSLSRQYAAQPGFMNAGMMYGQMGMYGSPQAYMPPQTMNMGQVRTVARAIFLFGFYPEYCIPCLLCTCFSVNDDTLLRNEMPWFAIVSDAQPTISFREERFFGKSNYSSKNINPGAHCIVVLGLSLLEKDYVQSAIRI